MRMPVTQCVLTPDRIIFSASHMSLKNDRNLVVFQVAVERFLSSHPYILIGTSAHFQSWFRHFFFLGFIEKSLKAKSQLFYSPLPTKLANTNPTPWNLYFPILLFSIHSIPSIDTVSYLFLSLHSQFHLETVEVEA